MCVCCRNWGSAAPPSLCGGLSLAPSLDASRRLFDTKSRFLCERSVNRRLDAVFSSPPPLRVALMTVSGPPGANEGAAAPQPTCLKKEKKFGREKTREQRRMMLLFPRSLHQEVTFSSTEQLDHRVEKSGKFSG